MEDFVRQIGVRALDTRLKRIADAMSHSSRMMYKTLNMDIEPNWYLVLTLIKRNNSISVVELAQSMGFAHQSINIMAAKMVTKGYLLQRKAPEDRRRTIFELTEKANKILPLVDTIWDKGEEIFREIVPNISDLLQQLERIENKLNETSFGDRILSKIKTV